MISFSGLCTKSSVSKGLSALLFSFIFYTAIFGEFTTMTQYGVPFMISLILAFIYFPSFKAGKIKALEPIVLWLGIFTTIIVVGYPILYYEKIVYHIGRIPLTDAVIGLIGGILVLYTTQRATGNIFPAIVLLFLFYAYFGKYIPGYFGHPGFPIARIARYIWFGGGGVFGIAHVTMVRFIYLFILFGSFLKLIRLDKFIMDIALGLFGRISSGPAQAAVLSSALMGTMSGSAVANVATTGTFTIPLMKSKGYRPEFAGAVEAAASSGSQIMPPVMGASAFIMAEIMGISYTKVCVAAAIPAILYFFAIGIAVHFEARRVRLRGIEIGALPDWREAVKSGWYLVIPIVLLFMLLILGYTPGRSVVIAILSTYMIGIFTKRALSPKAVLTAIENGTKSSIPLFVICGSVGIIIVSVGMAGVGNKFAEIITSYAGSSIFLVLFFAMISSLILGMGLPTPAAYIIVAIIVTPSLIGMSVIPMAAHFFAFYFAIISAVTPPVALAAYTGARLAGSNEFNTALIAMRLALPSFIIGYLLVYNPVFLMIGNPFSIVLYSIMAAIGIVGIAAGNIGFFIEQTRVIDRIFLIAFGILLTFPEFMSGIAGLLGLLGVGLIQIYKKRRRE